MPHFDFIEIGTSDFDTLIQTCPDEARGLSVEPLKVYLDRLPNKQNVTKINSAVSDRIGRIDIFYVQPEIITEYGLPDWIKGCNSVNKSHPTVVRELCARALDMDRIITKDTVPVLTIADLIRQYDITSIDTFKVDTEGHDCVILADYIRLCDEVPELLANTIIFETNCLSSVQDQTHILQELLRRGYRILSRSDDTVLCRA